MSSTVTGSATLASMEQEGKTATEEAISPVGRSIDDLIAELEEHNPDFKRENEETRPRRELARIVMVRREELGISQKELADRMGTSVAVISRLERSRQNFSLATLQRLATALDTKLSYTFEPKLDEEPTRVVVP
jgi:ribosome-binding protein aMBF1 (putative translation factor)